MTTQETQMILAMLSIAYPNFRKGKDDATIKLEAQMWANAMQEFNYADVKRGMETRIISGNVYTPNLSEVICMAKRNCLDPMDNHAQMQADYRRNNPSWVNSGAPKFTEIELDNQAGVTT